MKLQTTDLAFSFEGKPILEHIDLRVQAGEFVSILGPSGCGKSTLLNLIAGILAPDGGSIAVDGRQISRYSPHFAYLPQQDLLMPWKTILSNVCLYGRLHGNLKELRARALESFPVFGLAGYENSYPDELSGGMRQRAAFLRTALCEADILLLDEPFGALDVITRGEMQDWLLNMREALSRTTILVTHDIEEALYLSDRVLLLGGSPAAFVREIAVPPHDKSREWLFDQRDLYREVYSHLKGEPHAG